MNVLNAADPNLRPEHFVVSISPQSRASLAATAGISVAECQAALWHFFHTTLRCEALVDTDHARNLALALCGQEFVENVRAPEAKLQRPILASACPGWICYAEKTHHEALPHISHVRSPQQLTGRVIKDRLSQAYGCPRNRIYHVAIMPCFDKKLEASRDEFTVDGARDVDCVITSLEMVEMLRAHNTSLRQLYTQHVADSAQSLCAEPDSSMVPSVLADFAPRDGVVREHVGSSSGGYVAHVLTYAAAQLYGIHDIDVATGRGLAVSVHRNQDMVEYCLVGPNDEVLLKMATCYGFRNIQNLVRRLKGGPGGGGAARRVVKRTRPANAGAAGSRDRPYDWVEVMACPGGCINGGGQLRADAIESPEGQRFTPREWMAYVEHVYRDEAAQMQVDMGSAEALLASMSPGTTESHYNAVQHTIGNPLEAAGKW